MIIAVNLSRNTVTRTPVPQWMLNQYFGGRGLAVALIASMGPRPAGPFDPMNPVVFAPGLLTGTGAPSSARWAVAAKAPATGFVSAGNGGGLWGARLAWCGVRALVVTGRASRPVLIRIAAGETPGPRVEVVPCDDLWGMDTLEAACESVARWGGSAAASFACIGPAGERLVPLANIIADGARAAGRGGLGAVLGSKNLKGIITEAAEPPESVSVRRSERCARFNVVLRETPYFKTHARWGTINALRKYNQAGGLVVRNGLAGEFAGTDRLSGEVFEREFKTSSRACYACPLPCSNTFEIKTGEYAGVTGEAASASTVKEYGARCGVEDMAAVLAAHALANRMGLEMISLGGVLSFGMECRERRLLDHILGPGQPDLRFGDGKAMLDAIPLIARREGIGAILGLGVHGASRVIGGDSHRFALHVKGLETPATDPRAYPSWGLGYAVSSRGGCHMRAFPVAETGSLTVDEGLQVAGVPTLVERGTLAGRGSEVAFFEDMRAVSDSLGVCKFIFRDGSAFPDAQGQWLGVSRVSLPAEDLRTVGERINNLERLMNLEDGLDPADDTLPERFTHDPLPGGASAGRVCDIARLVDDYYAVRDWDTTSGHPNSRVLERLGLPPKGRFDPFAG
ncbi:MAG: hypothetical protein HPY55_01580 [Firmicutes bacterium]|nr:hypothetical protein [Bacillota bacterium]